VGIFVALGIQNEMRKRHIVMWPAPLYNIFPRQLISKLQDCRGKIYWT